ncbi:MAG: polyprenyl synthetase family protein [Firmicutes bacterium]|nr:polyprenyl synthetase family protein [Bacillota bacterium]
MSKIFKNYPEIMDELEDVKKIMKKSIRSSEKYFDEAISPMIDNGGKLLRPGFLILSGKFGSYEKDRFNNLAAVIELLHMATLVHDDIIDESNLRRNTESIQSKYGKEYAVYTGDYLFSQCLIMLSEYDYDKESLKNISKVISKICLGEIKQFNFRYATDMNFRKYVRIASGKTAALFSLSLYVGAKESKCEESITKTFAKIGYNIGMAFQIIDDLLDYKGDNKSLGKEAQRDLIKGYYTLPLIFAINKDKNNDIRRILNSDILDDNDIEKILELVNKYEGVKKARNVAKKYTFRAYDNIEKLPDCKWKNVIKEIAKGLLERKY